MIQTQKDGLTPREILDRYNGLTEDQINSDESFMIHFNNAIQIINIKGDFLFPEINENDLEVSYPNLEINTPVPLNVFNSNGTPKSLTNINGSFDNYIKFFSISQLDNTKRGDFLGIFDVSGGSLSQDPTENLYRIKIALRYDEAGTLLDSISDIVKISRVKSKYSPIEFKVTIEDEVPPRDVPNPTISNSKLSFYIYLKPQVGRVFKKINVNSEIITNNNVEYKIDLINEDVTNKTLDRIDNQKEYYKLPQKYIQTILIPLIDRSVKNVEGEPNDRYFNQDKDISVAISTLIKDAPRVLPYEIYSNKIKNLVARFNSNRLFRN